MEFRTLQHLAATIVRGSTRLPGDIDLVVGIPRSGLLAGNLLALHLNLPLADLEGFLDGRRLGGGQREAGRIRDQREPRRILILDDSLCSGAAMDAARQRLATSPFADRLLYGAVYVAPGREHLVDFSFESCPLPRFFEWNFMHHAVLEHACVDIDGVLCLDPTEEDNDDGERYRRFLSTAAPLHRPTVEIHTLVTCRLEKYRDLTEAWLQARGIRYRSLVMLDLPTKAERQRQGRYGVFKGEIYRSTSCSIFIESSASQAIEIADKSRRPVFCVELGTTIFPSASSLVSGMAAKAPRAIERRINFAKSRVGSWLLRRLSY